MGKSEQSKVWLGIVQGQQEGRDVARQAVPDVRVESVPDAVTKSAGT